jgi:hypothetical protein
MKIRLRQNPIVPARPGHVPARGGLSLFTRIALGVVAVSLLSISSTGSAAPRRESRPAARVAGVVGTVNTVRSAPLSPIDPEVAVNAGLSPDVLRLALSATSCAASSGAIETPRTLTVIDYSRPSVEPRLWVFDFESGDLLFRELVAHGKNTGENLAREFSNEMNSRQTSLGLFVTGDTYVGSNGYSLKLDGLDVGFNDRARDRAIVMHGAPYVSEHLAAAQGRIGRSWGCPALRTAIAPQLIDTIRGGGVIFSYYPDEEWLQTSKFLKGCSTT